MNKFVFITIFILVLAMIITSCESSFLPAPQTNTTVPPHTQSLAPETTPTLCFDFITSHSLTPTPGPFSYQLDERYSRILISETTCAPKEEIVRKLVSQWLDHYSLNGTTVESYTIDKINIITKTQPLPAWANGVPDDEIWAGVSFHIKPYWSWPVTKEVVLSNDWGYAGQFFGVYRDGDYWRLFILETGV